MPAKCGGGGGGGGLNLLQQPPDYYSGLDRDRGREMLLFILYVDIV